MSKPVISEAVKYIGVDDRELDLFESQYPVPNGVSYNAYVILDEKIALMDAVDAKKKEEWLNNLSEVLGERTPDYLVVSHMEPDHAGSIEAAAERYPAMKIVANARTFAMMPQFFETDFTERQVVKAEGETLLLGEHCLQFFMAPMVHWPEVMVEYEQKEKILFSADSFGKFGALDSEEYWACEARRYYFNIVGKFGAQVQALLKKAAALDIRTICPLHGPILTENLGYYLEKYNIWSSYRAEDEGVLIAYASIHGNTKKAAQKLADILKKKGEDTVVLTDLARADMAEAVEDAFRYDKLVVASATYDGGVFPCMESFLHLLKSKGYQKRKAAIIENGTWAPSAGKWMRAELESMKQVEIVDPILTIRSVLKQEQTGQMKKLADALLKQ